MAETILKMEHISKTFGGVQALNDVSFECVKGEVHVLAGENGAGKSTILKVLSGIHQIDSGTITLHGKPVKFRTPMDSQRNGIAMVYQELTLIQELTVAENIFLNIESTGKGLHVIDKKSQMKQLQSCMDAYGIHIDPGAIVARLPVAQQQLVEILKILVRKPEIIILDEPTSSLAKKEVETLYEVIHTLIRKGKTVIFISHRMEEVFTIGDRVTVLKDGCCIGTRQISDINTDELIRMMVGRTLQNIFPPHSEEKSDENIFEVKNVRVERKGDPINFSIRKGEILGIAGLQGQGQTELLNAISGIQPLYGGAVYINGRLCRIKNCRQAIKEGIALIPGDRKQEGLFLNLSIRHNLSLVSLNKLTRIGLISHRREKAFVQDTKEKMHIKMADMDAEVSSLSGGNQQKVVLGKELAIQPAVLLFNEPTRGIDVEAKREFYNIMRHLSDEGAAVVMSSSDLMEVIGVSDRVLVMYENSVSAILSGSQITEENIMRCAMGLNAEEESGELTCQ